MLTLNDILKFVVNKLVFKPPHCDTCASNGVDCDPPAPDAPPWPKNCERVAIRTADALSLEAWYFKHKNPRAYVVSSYSCASCLHCWADWADEMRRRYNVAILSYSYRGYDNNPGEPDVETVLLDGDAAVKWLSKNTGIKPSEFIMHGYSLGGTLAAMLAAKHKTKGLILTTGFAGIGDLAPRYCGQWLGNMLRPLVEPYLNAADALSKYYGILLQGHGTCDEVVPWESGRELFDACPSEDKQFVLMRGKTHDDSHTVNYTRKEKEFFAKF